MRTIKNGIIYSVRTLILISANLIGPVILLFLYILKPFKSVKIIQLRVERIGHLAANTDLFLRRLQSMNAGKNNIFYIGIADGRVANKQLIRMFRRKMFIIQNMLFFRLLSNSNILKRSNFYEISSYNLNEFHEFNNTAPNLYFTAPEEEMGKKFLKEMNIENSWFVCFHSRDPAYLSDELPSADWSYNDYRDSDVKNYLKAAGYITSSGGYALRMGHVVKEKLTDLNDPFIIDYANIYRNDFMDIYLLAKCKFFLGNTAGLFDVATIFHVPVALANMVPLHTPFRKGDLFIPKKIWSVEKNRFLNFREILDSEIARYDISDQYKKAGLIPMENTAEEILDLAMEMNERLDGNFKYTEEDEILQNKFRSLIKPHHIFYGTPARIGAKFLRKNKELLD